MNKIRLVRYVACVVGVVALAALAPVRAQTAAPQVQAPSVQPPSGKAPPPPAAPDRVDAPVAPPPSRDIKQADQAIDGANAALNEIEKNLQNHNLSDAELAAMRQSIGPIGDAVNAAADRIAPRLAEIKARLAQLGPPPDDKSPPENQNVTDERTAQQQSFSNADELLKRTMLLSVRADQLKTEIAGRRRALFTRSLFQQSASVANASLWTDVSRDAPANLAYVGKFFSDWAAKIATRIEGWRLTAFWLAFPAIVLAYIPIARLAMRAFARNAAIEKPSRLLKILGAWWVALVIAVPPIALTFLAIYGLNAAGLTSPRIQSVLEAAGAGVVRIGMMAGLARGLLAPSRPNWRLPRVSDRAAGRLVAISISVALIVSLTRFCEALNEAIDASLAFAVATRSIGALMAATALAVGVWRTGSDAGDLDCFGPPATRRQTWFPLLRGIAMAAAAVIAAAVLAGYPTFASFFLDQVIWISGVATLYFMASILAQEAIGAGFKPAARFGNWLVNRIGLQRNSLELLGVVLSGVLRVAFFIVAVVAALAPWGLQSAEVPFDLRAAFFGFKVGDVVISPISITVAVAIFGLASAAVHALQRWLDSSLLPHTGLDAGLRNSITTSLGYVGFLLAAGLALGYLGLSFEKLAIVAGALSVGIGFGLQSIVNNFVSGLILLWERAVRVGDWIIVGGDQGFVRRINVRSTEIETIDRAQVIIPNSSLITGVVKNLVRNDRTGRVVIPVTVAGAADPEKVREVLFAAAKSNDRVLKMPTPQIFFTGMSGAALTFELAAFVADVETMARVRSDLHFEIFRQFRENGFFNSPTVAQKIEIIGAENFAVPAAIPGDPAQDRPTINVAVG